MKKLILFGAGVYAKKYKALLDYLHMDFDYFTDNDSSKWGTMLYGKLIIPPEELKNYKECQIVISSTHEIAIRKQLSEWQLTQNLIDLDELYKLCEYKMKDAEGSEVIKNQFRTIIVDMYEGIGWGGSELWAAGLAEWLHNVGEKVLLMGGMEQKPLEEEYEKLIVRVPEKETIKHMVNCMRVSLPCVFINNFAGCGFMAAIILKKQYPDLVKIISVIHNDNKSLFDAHMMLNVYIDKIFCVSNQIKKHMQSFYKFEHDKYFFKEQPIETEDEWKRNWNCSEPIRIGYAARLVKQQKRADLLLSLISYLEAKKTDYFFQIAGEGECLESLELFVKKHNLVGKVQLLGHLPKSEMSSFWKNQDIFVNLSEYEGTSLSMLEAMSYGCVPVVTDVSGVREFINENKNGCICEIGDVEGIAGQIIGLTEDREKLKNYGKECRRIIQERCNPKEYVKYWVENLL